MSAFERVALVTGSGSGLGRVTAMAFARDGYGVAVSDVNPEFGVETVATIRRAGGQASFFEADVSQPAAVQQLVADVASSFGSLHVAVNNAGIVGPSTPFHEYHYDAWDRLLAVNLTGVFLCMQSEVSHMRAAGGGAIVNVSSRAGLVGAAGRGGYAATKHGVVGLTRTAAVEYAGQGIRVNAVCPGAIMTPMLESVLAEDPGSRSRYEETSPMARLALPEEVADSIVWLCSPAASFINGAALPIDGGAAAR
jgi:NAD(P)-dependent dehydrogenase (short-subunit alcohol dehydrogenase family)